jgi:hypothetical protein
MTMAEKNGIEEIILFSGICADMQSGTKGDGVEREDSRVIFFPPPPSLLDKKTSEVAPLRWWKTSNDICLGAMAGQSASPSIPLFLTPRSGGKGVLLGLNLRRVYIRGRI